MTENIGVNFRTETGQLMTSFREVGDKDWNYVRVSQALQPYLRWEMRSQGIYELIVLDGLPSKVASNRPDRSYATKDLFTPHPSTPNAWKYYARLDDTIALLNGEKTEPTAFEQPLRDLHCVKEAVVLGNGKPRLGMMVIPSAATVDMTEETILASVQTVLQKTNELMPSFAKLDADMIKILPRDTQYPRTDKGTVIRAAFYRQFETQIDAVYDASETASGELCLSEEELQVFIQSHLVGLLALQDPSILGIDTDFFSLGVDSLQAIQLRSILTKNIQTNGQQLGSNVVFDFPTLRSLARNLYCLRIGQSSEIISIEQKIAGLITKYSTFEAHVPQPNEYDGEYLVSSTVSIQFHSLLSGESANAMMQVVTGATGSLGAHLVSQLVLRDEVKGVFCLVRASSKANARMRVIRSLRARALRHELPLAARQKIVPLPANFSAPNLGLDDGDYDDITARVTSVVHCAWSVNFNLGLGSFEADCIASERLSPSLFVKSLLTA